MSEEIVLDPMSVMKVTITILREQIAMVCPTVSIVVQLAARNVTALTRHVCRANPAMPQHLLLMEAVGTALLDVRLVRITRELPPRHAQLVIQATTVPLENVRDAVPFVQLAHQAHLARHIIVHPAVPPVHLMPIVMVSTAPAVQPDMLSTAKTAPALLVQITAMLVNTIAAMF